MAVEMKSPDRYISETFPSRHNIIPMSSDSLISFLPRDSGVRPTAMARMLMGGTTVSRLRGSGRQIPPRPEPKLLRAGAVPLEIVRSESLAKTRRKTDPPRSLQTRKGDT